MHDDSPENPAETRRPLLRSAVVAILVLLAVAAVKSYSDLAEARAHETELEEEIRAVEQRIEILREHVDRIENDPTTLEQLAREELGWVREGDVVIVLPEEDPTGEDEAPRPAGREP
ncbi:MAG: septum formation initiator family protein [Holophagales bacterium]|nr:septum formation initiator family protein [Holophagales bacterium]